jgi:hypothetical protein
MCGHLFEDSIHFLHDCPLYQHDRTSLFNYFNNNVPISIEYILFGCNEISEELNTLYCSNQCKYLFELTSPSPYKYSNNINKTYQMTANVQAISIISKLSKIMSS